MTSMGAKKASKGRRRAVDEDNASQHTSASSDVMFFGLFRCVSAGFGAVSCGIGNVSRVRFQQLLEEVLEQCLQASVG